jgi:hypothetical protein
MNVGFTGPVTSLTYVIASVEHADVFPTPSVAVARNVVDRSAGTVTSRPGDAKLAALPLATAVPEQSAVVNRRTVEPASADPTSFGLVLCAGDTGTLAVNVGFTGPVTSLT